MKKQFYSQSLTVRLILTLIAILFTSALFSQTLTDGLELHYTFDEIVSSTKIADQIGANDGTLINGATIGSDEKHTYLDLPDEATTARPYLDMGAGVGTIISTLEDFSISLFLQVPAGYKNDFVWDFSNSENIGTDANGQMFFDCVHQKTAITPTHHEMEPGNKVEVGSGIATDAWQHITFVLKDSVGTYFVNAVALASDTLATLPKDLGATAYNWIGRCSYDGGGATTGQYNVNPAKIADFRIYSRALSTDEITTLSGDGSSPSSTDIQGLRSNVSVYPNPFSTSVKINYELLSSQHVRLEILSIDGKVLETIVNENQAAGTYNAEWHPQKNVQGIYLYKLVAGEKVTVERLVKQ